MGFTGQALLVACALVAPMISPQVLPRVTWITSLAPPGPPPPPPPAPDEAAVQRSQRVVPSQILRNTLLLPRSIPPKALILEDPEPVMSGGGVGVAGGIAGGREGGVPGGLLNSLIDEASRIVPVVRPPETSKPQPAKTASAPAAPLRITVLKMATPVHKVEPVYPTLAKQARVSGTVELLGVLGTDGRIHEIKVVRGHPLLVKAAIDAVLQWVFEPTILNGQAVEVSAPVTVNFILNQ
jgi:protein TonB